MRTATGRVCVTLPLETLEDFKEKSLMTGLSVSRLIYRRLRSRKPITIVSDNVLSGLDQLHSMLERIEKNGIVDAETLGALRLYVEHADRIVEYESPEEVIHVRIKKRKTQQKEAERYATKIR